MGVEIVRLGRIWNKDNRFDYTIYGYFVERVTKFYEIN